MIAEFPELINAAAIQHNTNNLLNLIVFVPLEWFFANIFSNNKVYNY
jgi:hypothetical protein